MSENIYKDIVNDIKDQFTNDEIDVLIKIYRWTKSERNRYFFSQILKRIPNYRKSLKKLRAKGFVSVVKSQDPHKITEDGIRVGGLMLQLKEDKLL